MVGLALVAVIPLSAVAAGPASATTNVWNKFAECPLNYPELNACTYGKTGPESFFQAGKVTVHFVKPIVLQIGLKEEEGVYGELKIVGAEGGRSVTKVNEPAPPLTEDINAAELSATEKARYEAYLAAGKSTKATATIELAKPAADMEISLGALLSETSATALAFPVMIRLNNAFVGKNCTVGSTQSPINVSFITGETAPPPPNAPIHGTLGSVHLIGEGNILQILGDRLVNNSYASPGVQSCGINGGADAAMNSALGLPSPAGTNSTELVGELAQAGAQQVREHIKF
jgi:hypothetical protein